MKAFTNPHTLFQHISLRLIFLSIVTVLAIGVPAIIFLRYELNQQIWAQIDQGARTSLAIISVKELELSNSSKLVAERPTLIELIQSQDDHALYAYLSILQNAIKHDSITVCDNDGKILGETRKFRSFSVCPSQNYPLVIQQQTLEAWMFKTHPIEVSDQSFGTVVVGDKLDNQFAVSMRNDTGLDYSIVYSGEVLATSLKPVPLELDHLEFYSEGQVSQTTFQQFSFTLENAPYYAIKYPLTVDGLENQLALPVGEIIQASQRQVMLILISIFAVLSLAILLSSIIAHRVSRPLVELASQAMRSGQEFIHTPIKIDTSIAEVITLAKAYENARINLSQSLYELQKEQDWNKHLLEAIIEGILTLDSNNNILFFSPAAERITGWKGEEVLHHPIDDFFKLTDKNDVFSLNIPSPGEKQFLNVELANKRHTTLSISGAEFLPNEASDSQIVLVFRDVTEEVAINRLLGQFLSNVAHEFRTPLSALSASVELLEDQYPEFNRDEVMELIKSQRLGILGLETLIDNLLESSSIEARRFRVTPRSFDIEKIIADVGQTMSPLLEKHGQRLVISMPPHLPLVQADPRRTVQVLINLLSNAIKYGPENSEILLHAHERDRKMRVSVSDYGPGISPEYRQEIFTRFNIPRTDNERAKPGAGLGLSVVKAIVEAQGGEVGVDDSPGSGACFWFTMRLAKH